MPPKLTLYIILCPKIDFGGINVLNCVCVCGGGGGGGCASVRPSISRAYPMESQIQCVHTPWGLRVLHTFFWSL